MVWFIFSTDNRLTSRDLLMLKWIFQGHTTVVHNDSVRQLKFWESVTKMSTKYKNFKTIKAAASKIEASLTLTVVTKCCYTIAFN